MSEYKRLILDEEQGQECDEVGDAMRGRPWPIAECIELGRKWAKAKTRWFPWPELPDDPWQEIEKEEIEEAI